MGTTQFADIYQLLGLNQGGSWRLPLVVSFNDLVDYKVISTLFYQGKESLLCQAMKGRNTHEIFIADVSRTWFCERDFSESAWRKSKQVTSKGVAPDNYHATTNFPEYFKVAGEWMVLSESRMDCVVVLKNGGGLKVKEARRLEVGDLVITGRTEDASEGIFVHVNGFRGAQESGEVFSFRTGRSRETSYSRDYDMLYDLLRYEKDCLWCLHMHSSPLFNLVGF